MLNKKKTGDTKTKKYILRFQDLMQPGDVILTAAPTISSKGIRKATKSDFSHAILYLGNSYMHSDLHGVHSGNPQRLLFESPKDVKVLRLKKEYINTQVIENICTFARSEHGKEYSKFEAAKSVLTPNALRQKNRQFCSRLVAQSFENSNIRIVNNTNYCTPHEISISKCFEEVKNVIKLATDEEIEFSKSDNPLYIQESIINKLLTDIRILLSNDIQTLEEIIPFLISNHEYDSQITNVLKESGYLDIWRIDYDKNPWRYDGSIFLKFKNKKELIKFKNNIGDQSLDYDDLRIAMAYGELSLFSGITPSVNEGLRYEHQYNLYSYLYRKYNFDYFYTKKNLYEQLLKNCRKRIVAAEYVLNHYR
ncbi:YiiX/YebB-like N1pC/P60 family cysteine hydrolase [Acinetobacter sp. 3657]|uniref:YiiX/YebB-like N1pC/P60 family cysteine hydrolase n=1 Tax=Acinetobacter sp. 3657 TaxID=2817764 RepID=UPI00285ED02A|nr:hypothetical protein [Prolinoborus sp. 3657]